MSRHFPPHLLRTLRNSIPIDSLIAKVLKIPNKTSEGYFRFLCPICSDFHTATKKETNLARCFRCKRNFNPIDMVMVVKNLKFTETVNFLNSILSRYRNTK